MTYGALTAGGLGVSPAVVTSFGPELDLAASMPGIPVHNVPSASTTTFQNTYREGRRTQVLSGLGAKINGSDIPPEWRSAPLVLLGPLAGELGDELAQGFPGAIVMASIQGWLRQWDDQGRVSPAHWDGAEVLPYVDAATFSIEDIGDRRPIDRWKQMVPVLILTMGADGASLHFGGSWHHIPAFPAREVDPTGAGDVFAAAYLIRYKETFDPLQSARFATCAASLCVEADGIGGIPTRDKVEARLATF